MKQFEILAVLLLAASGIVKATYTDCGSTAGTIKTIDISGCEDSEEKCELHRNTNVTFKLTFTTLKSIEKVNAVVHGEVLDVLVPFKLPNSDGCVDSGLQCPLASGQTYTYETSLPVLKKYPRLSVNVKWELKNEAEEDIVCINIPAKLV